MAFFYFAVCRNISADYLLLRTSILLTFSRVNEMVSDSDFFCVLLKLLLNRTTFIFGRKQKLQITLLRDHFKNSVSAKAVKKRLLLYLSTPMAHCRGILLENTYI